MAKVEGLNLRGSRWYVLIIVPKDLGEAYGFSRKNVSLGTSDRKVAVVAATVKRAEWMAGFEQKRREQKLTPVESVSPELADLMAQMVHAEVLATDDELRDDRELWADMARATGAPHTALLVHQEAPVVAAEDDLRGLDAAEAGALATFNAHLDGRAAIAMAGRNLAAVLPVVQAQARRLGLFIDPKAPGAKSALLQSLKAYRQGHQEKLLRDAGEVVETPAVVVPSEASKVQPAAKARTLRDAFDRWKTSGEKVRSADSIAACERALRQFEERHPEMTLEAITRDMGDNYRAWLRTACKTSKTASDRLTSIKSLLKYASETLQWLTLQPWRGISIKATTTNCRRPWSQSELATLFASPLHQSYELPTARDAGGDAAYWIPLLALYTGARAGELCQLQAEDIKTIEGIPAIVITDDGEGQKVKTEAGKRTIPVHSELLRLGFMEYVAAIQAKGAGSLWPVMRLRKGKPSDFFGRWFKDHREGLGLPGKGGPSLHYFRHTVRPLMRRAGFDSGTMDKITGHETGGSVGDLVYDHWLLEELRPAVEAIQFPFLKLRAVSSHRR